MTLLIFWSAISHFLSHSSPFGPLTNSVLLFWIMLLPNRPPSNFVSDLESCLAFLSLMVLIMSPCCSLPTSYPWGGLIKSSGFQYHLIVDDPQLYLPTLERLLTIQYHISNCLSDISGWLVHCHLKFCIAKTKLLVFLLKFCSSICQQCISALWSSPAALASSHST